MTDAQMQAFAAWTNLAETTFLLPPKDARADYALRIFTPGREMPFAGHPTLGSCAAWLHAGGVPKADGTVWQECGIGLVEIDTKAATPAFVAPAITVAPLAQADQDHLVQALELEPGQVVRAAQLDNGSVWQVLELQSADDVLAIDAARVAWPTFVGVGVVGPHPAGSAVDYEVRNLAPSSGMSEDPITGSLNAAIAQWMHHDGRLTRDLTMSQGTQVNREGRVFIRKAGDKIKVGGQVQILIEGTLTV